MPFDPDESAALDSIAALGEPVRRRLYEVVVGADGPVGREEAAVRAEVAVHTARFHLDRLVEDGLLEVEYRRLSGRTGPGAGRPAKLYRRAARDIDVSLPARHYDLLSRILARAVAEAEGGGEPVADLARRVAGEHGRAHGKASGRRGPELTRVTHALAASGYEPVLDDGAVRARNCPFHRAAQDQTQLVCSLNVAYVDGICTGLGCRAVSAHLEPWPGHCCVVVRSGA